MYSSRMASLIGREAAIPAKALARLFLIFLPDMPYHELQRIPAGWLAPNVPQLGTIVGAQLQSLMNVRLRQLAESTILVYLIRGVGWVFGNILTRSQPLLGLSWTIWVGIRFQTCSIQWPIVAFYRSNLACAECCEGAGQLVRSLDDLGNKGGASRQRFEGLRLLAPFLNIWFLRLPMPC
ncbi:hypothetical protein CK203_026532 [Vitis vinifera]|uniref:Uncharacterized protein n=1 Tax=Vitis vinifera TaxID=29760 RepID=A0A438IW16_VITVI|nr:hypothetical protein CK203_026532 [Vitis vinifera]